MSNKDEFPRVMKKGHPLFDAVEYVHGDTGETIRSDQLIEADFTGVPRIVYKVKDSEGNIIWNAKSGQHIQTTKVGPWTPQWRTDKRIDVVSRMYDDSDPYERGKDIFNKGYEKYAKAFLESNPFKPTFTIEKFEPGKDVQVYRGVKLRDYQRQALNSMPDWASGAEIKLPGKDMCNIVEMDFAEAEKRILAYCHGETKLADWAHAYGASQKRMDEHAERRKAARVWDEDQLIPAAARYGVPVEDLRKFAHEDFFDSNLCLGLLEGIPTMWWVGTDWRSPEEKDLIVKFVRYGDELECVTESEIDDEDESEDDDEFTGTVHEHWSGAAQDVGEQLLAQNGLMKDMPFKQTTGQFSYKPETWRPASDLQPGDRVKINGVEHKVVSPIDTAGRTFTELANAHLKTCHQPNRWYDLRGDYSFNSEHPDKVELTRGPEKTTFYRTAVTVPNMKEFASFHELGRSAVQLEIQDLVNVGGMTWMLTAKEISA